MTCFLTCVWLVHDLFMILSWLNHDLFLTYSLALDLLLAYLLLVYELFMTCPCLVYDFCMNCKWLAHEIAVLSWLRPDHDLFLSYSIHAHYLFIACSSLIIVQDLSMTGLWLFTCSWFVHNKFINCSFFFMTYPCLVDNLFKSVMTCSQQLVASLS